MADTTIRQLLVKLGVQADTDKLAKFDAGVSKVATGMRDLAIAGAAGIAALFGVADAAAAAGDAAEKGAQKTGTQVEAYQELIVAGSRAGLTSEQVEQGLIKQAQAMAQLTEASGPAFEAYQRLGLAQEQLAGLSPDEALQVTAEALVGVSSETERLQLATSIYGEELGARLLPLLNQGSDGIAQLRQEARDMGLILDAEAAAASAEFNDRLADTIDIAKGLRNTFGLALIPEINRLLTRFRDWFIANREVIDQKLDDYAERIGKAITSAANTVDTIVEKIGGWDVALGLVTAGFSALAAAWTAFKVGTVIVGLVQIGQAIAAIGTPLLFVVGAALSLAQAVAVWAGWALVLEEILTYLDGGDSLLGRFIERFREGDGILGAFARALESVFGFLQAVLPIAAGLLDQVVAIFARLAEIAAPAVNLIAQAFGMWLEGFLLPVTLALETISALFDALTSRAPQVGSALSSALGAVAGFLGADTGSLAPSAPESTVGGSSVSNSQTNSYSYTFNGLDTSDIEALMASQQDADARAVSEAATAGVA